MKNADQPINPTLINTAENGNMLPVSEYNSSRGLFNTGSIGLTKREYFAAIALQAIIAKQGTSTWDKNAFAKWAINQADELLKQLDKK